MRNSRSGKQGDGGCDNGFHPRGASRVRASAFALKCFAPASAPARSFQNLYSREDRAFQLRPEDVSAGSQRSGEMKRRRRKNLLRGLILSFAVAAIVIPTAQARVSNYNPSAQSQQSLTDINQIQRQLEAQKIQRLIKQEEQEKASALRRPDDRAGL